MTTKLDKSKALAEEITHSEEKLEELEKELQEIGKPAASALRHRLDALKIEEHALQRNFAEAQVRDTPDHGRMEKVESLLHHIEREEASIEHEADFLHLGAPSSVSLAVEGGTRLCQLGARGLKRILRDHHPWRSPFVNRTYTTIKAKFDLPAEDDK